MTSATQSTFDPVGAFFVIVAAVLISAVVFGHMLRGGKK